MQETVQTETELRLSIWQRRSLTFGYQADSAKRFIFKTLQYLRNRIQIKQDFTSPRQRFLSNTLDSFCRRPNPFFCPLSGVSYPLPKCSCRQIFSAGVSSLQLQGKRSSGEAVLPSSDLLSLTYRLEMCFVFAGHPEETHLLVPPPILFGSI